MTHADYIANFYTLTKLEYLGVRIEDARNDETNGILFFFSVPEHSVLKSSESGHDIKTSDGLIELTKQTLLNIVWTEFDNASENECEDFRAQLKEKYPDWIKCYAKVRKGEVWNKELAEAAVQELTEELKKLSEYQEV